MHLLGTIFSCELKHILRLKVHLFSTQYYTMKGELLSHKAKRTLMLCSRMITVS